MLRALLVDDEPYIVQGLSVLIDWNAEGYEIAGTASNGQEALDFLRSKEVDLIIADIKMAVMTGIELLEAIRKEKISEAYFVILSGHRDFQYARTALRYDCMDYLLKPIQKEELIQIVRKVAQNCKNAEQKREESRQMEKDCLARNVISLLSGKYDQLNLDYVQKHMRLSPGIRYIDMEIDDMELLEELSEEERRGLQRQMYQNCMDYLGERDSSHCIFDVSNQEKSYDTGFLYCRYMSEEKELTEKEYLQDFLNTVNNSMKIPNSIPDINMGTSMNMSTGMNVSTSMNMSIVMSVGSEVEDISKISESYYTASMIKSYRFFRTSRNIMYYEDEVRKDSSGTVLCKQNLDNLVHSIEQNDRIKINQNIEALYQEMNHVGLYADLVELNINYLMFQLIHLATEQNDNVNQEEIMHFISTGIFDRGTVWWGKKYLKRFACEYADYLVQLRKDMSRGVLAHVEREVRDHYSENLTLKELSRKYYINSAYLGQSFRKKYGQPFKDYLNSYRMEQAAIMLLRTDQKVYEIAEAVGYHDLDYFINRFITVKGCTPARFRKQSRE